ALDTRLRADARRCGSSHRALSPEPVRPRPRYLAAWRTAVRSRARDTLGFRPRTCIVGIGGSAFDPYVAALEEFPLPDRHGLFYALDRIAARGVGIFPVRRRRCDRDARFADLEPPNPVMDGQSHARPSAFGLAGNSGEC